MMIGSSGTWNTFQWLKDYMQIGDNLFRIFVYYDWLVDGNRGWREKAWVCFDLELLTGDTRTWLIVLYIVINLSKIQVLNYHSSDWENLEISNKNEINYIFFRLARKFLIK